jgi:hypothetical protein
METASFDNLPQESPVSYLDYGGTLTYIGELVKEKRKENRDQRRGFLIKKINNVNLGILVDKIKTEAENLRSYRAKEWLKGPSSKANYKKFFKSHDIPLQYLEDMYIVQSKGAPVIETNALIKINGWYTDAEYGVVVKHIGKSTIEYVSVTKDMMPASSWYIYGRPYITTLAKMNVWKCEVVGEFTPDNWAAYTHAIDDYNRNMKCRKEFWDNHPVLRTICKPYGYYNRCHDVMNVKIPKSYWENDRPTWIIFKNCIDEKLRLERENQ